MYQLQKKVFGLWPDLETMASDLGTSANVLRRQRDAFELPDPQHDPMIAQFSMAAGKRIRISDLIAARQTRVNIDLPERRQILSDFYKAVGGLKVLQEKTGNTKEYLSVSKNRGFLPKRSKRIFVELALEVGFDLPDMIFQMPKG